MNLNQWAIKWQIPFEAVEDLRREFGTINTDPEPVHNDGSEARVQTSIRLEASRVGCRLWRNNVGATKTDEGGHIRYGLANDSTKMNAVIKSADLIGIRPVTITEAHVGGVFGQFVAREVKREAWVYTGDKRELAQLKFLELINALGGDAAFATGVGTL
ncbi:MAG: hypothetical protein KAR42_14775 [candidate division Zixibacteria bacterium]|nr:hypothetical protein [candidate division Zixibacteria bacterium]